MRRTALAVGLLAAGSALGLFVWPEGSSGVGPLGGEGNEHYTNPDIADVDGGFLVVFEDSSPGDPLSDISSAWVPTQGQPWSDVEVVSRRRLRQASPRIDCLSDGCLAVWIDEGATDDAGAFATRPVAALLSHRGLRSQQEFTFAFASKAVAVAAGASNYLLAFREDVGFDNRVLVQLAQQSGQPIDVPTPVEASAPGWKANVEVAFNGSVYLVVWTVEAAGTYAVRGQLYTVGGVRVGSAFDISAATPGQPSSPRAAGGAGLFVVTWLAPGAGPHRPVAVRVLTSGTVLDPIPFQLDPAGSGEPFAGFDGTRVVVANSVSAEVRTREVSPVGYTAPVTLPPGDLPLLGLSFGSNGGLMVVKGGATGLATRVIVAGGVDAGPTSPALTPLGNESRARTAWTGADYLVTWVESSQGQQRLMSRRFDPRGVPVAPASILYPQAQMQRGHAVCFDGARTFAAWYSAAAQERVYVQSFSVASQAQWGSPVAASIDGHGMGENQEMACGPSGALVTWVTFPPTPGTGRVAGVLVAADGSLRNGPGNILGHVEPASWVAPAVAYGPGAYLVAVSDLSKAIRAMRVSSTGVALDDPELTLSMPGFPATDPAVASDGRNFFVVWLSQQSLGLAILGRDVFADGGTGPIETVVPESVSHQAHSVLPRVVWDGQRYVVGYQPAFVDGGVDAVAIGYKPSPGPTIALAATARDDHDLALAPGTVGRLLATTKRLDPARGGTRVFVTAAAHVPIGGVCFQTGECAAGTCVSGTCQQGGAGGGAGGGSAGSGGSGGASGGGAGAGGASGGAAGAGGTSGGTAGAGAGGSAGSGGAGGASGGAGGAGGGTTDPTDWRVQCGCTSGAGWLEWFLLPVLLRVTRKSTRR